MTARVGIVLLMLVRVPALVAQSVDTPSDAPPERWNLYYQATSIGQQHGTFRSPYSGPFSFHDESERAVSLTTTLFSSFRIARGLGLYFDPEIAGGKGLSGVNGIANAPNGEIPRVASVTPSPYLARLYLSYDVGFGSATESVDSGPNQLAGSRPATRYTVTVGRFSLSDFFDGNRYSHDPRSQFMAWGVMYNGAWDYPADTRGYTWGMVHELRSPNWSLRYGSAGEPTKANGGRFDRRVFVDRGDVIEGERRYTLRDHPGTIRLLQYWNHADAGNYAEALRAAGPSGTPDITAVHRAGTLKYGAGINWEQEIAKGIGVYTRLGWNDGKTQSFAFTSIDRLAGSGISVNGKRWRREDDTAATSFTAGGISGVHALYLARGGFDFLIGDGKLNYAPEYVWESYYNARLVPGLFAGVDVQRVVNPGYNQDRGPVWVSSLRLHMEFGLRPLTAK